MSSNTGKLVERRDAWTARGKGIKALGHRRVGSSARDMLTRLDVARADVIHNGDTGD